MRIKRAREDNLVSTNHHAAHNQQHQQMVSGGSFSHRVTPQLTSNSNNNNRGYGSSEGASPRSRSETPANSNYSNQQTSNQNLLGQLMRSPGLGTAIDDTGANNSIGSGGVSSNSPGWIT